MDGRSRSSSLPTRVQPFPIDHEGGLVELPTHVISWVLLNSDGEGTPPVLRPHPPLGFGTSIVRGGCGPPLREPSRPRLTARGAG